MLKPLQKSRKSEIPRLRIAEIKGLRLARGKITTLPSPVVVSVEPRAWLRWPKMPSAVGVTLVAFTLAGFLAMVGGLALVIFIDGYMKGYLSSYDQGKADGYQAVCDQATIQARAAIKTENDLVTSKHHTAATGAAVLAEIAGQLHFVCYRTVASGSSLYDPSTIPPMLPLGSPTLPKAAHQTRPSPILLSGLPKKKPTPSPSPIPEKKHGHD